MRPLLHQLLHQLLLPSSIAAMLFPLSVAADPLDSSQPGHLSKLAHSPTITLTVTPTSVAAGSPTTLTWSSTDAASCAASGAWSGVRSTANSVTLNPITTSTYTLTCSGNGGSTTQSVTVTIVPGGGFVPPYALPSPGQAIALGSHTAQDIRPSSYFGGYAGSWQYSLFDSYGGGVLVPSFSEAGAYVMAGTGGHNHPDFTGGVAFDFQTGIWKLLPDASGTIQKSTYPYAYVIEDGDTSSPEHELNLPNINGNPNPNFVPSPPHPYANLMPLPPELGGGPLGSVVYAIQGAQARESRTSSRSHRFDLSTRTWSRFTSNHLGDLNVKLSDSDAPSVYDPTAKRIWQLPVQIHSTQTIGYIDLTEASPQWRLSASWPYVSTWDSTHSAWLDDTRRLILMQSPTRLVALDLNNLTAGPRLLNFTGTLPPSGNRWELYPPDGSFYYKSYAGNVLWKLTPPTGNPLTETWSVTSFEVTGATLPSISAAAQAGGVRHYTRFFYVPSIASFAWIADSFNPVMLIRPPS